MAASSSFGPGVLLDVDGLHLRGTRLTEVRHRRRLTTSAGDPPAGSATKLLGRKATRYGPGPVNVVVTSLVPPNTGVVTLTLSPSTTMSVLFVSTGRSSLTDRRLTTSRPS